MAATPAARDRDVRARVVPPRGPIRLVVPGDADHPGDAADIRWSRVKAARARVAAGFYDRPDVRDRLLDAILDELTDR